MTNIVVIGAASAIAQETARLLAVESTRFLLVGRNEERLENIGRDLCARGSEKFDCLAVELRDADVAGKIMDRTRDVLGSVDIVLIMHGTLPDQAKVQDDFPETVSSFGDNVLSIIALCIEFSKLFREQGCGSLVVVSSVAGDRGRASNFVYGAAKSAVSTYLQGMRNRLFDDGVHVLTVKPGLIDTPMTKRFKKGFLWSSPERVARDIVRAIQKRRDVIYSPSFWRYIMWAIRVIPERIFKKLNL